MNYVTIESMVGESFSQVEALDKKELVFRRTDGTYVRFHHYQDCCESVYIEDICGDLSDLVGSPILVAEQCTQEDTDQKWDVGGWTFYRFATVKGTVTVRWYGTSNGYYSISVSVEDTSVKVTCPNFSSITK